MAFTEPLAVDQGRNWKKGKKQRDEGLWIPLEEVRGLVYALLVLHWWLCLHLPSDLPEDILPMYEDR